MKVITREEFAELAKSTKQRLRRELRFVPEEISDWEDRDFLVVTNRSKTEGLLVAPLEKLYVVPFQLQPRRPNSSGRTEAVICDFCASWQRGTNSAIITFPKEKTARSFIVCGDLSCSLHVRGRTPAAKVSRAQLRENIAAEERVKRLRRKLGGILADLTHS